MIQTGVLSTALSGKIARNDFLDSTTQKLQGAASGNLSKSEAKKVAQDFESLFVSQMVQHIFSGDSLGKDQFGSEETDEIYKSMMVDQYAKAIVKSGGIGIASYIERSLAQRALLTAQEVPS
ncbi:MAG: rod-binding protein [Alphaproteobacteria bacterium]|nr:rod-binding protein [Alphaproteobacteria bacterium]